MLKPGWLGASCAIDKLIGEYGWEGVLRGLRLSLSEHLDGRDKAQDEVAIIVRRLRELAGDVFPAAPGSARNGRRGDHESETA